MSDYEYDENLPYVVAHKMSGRVIGRFHSHAFAEDARGTRQRAENYEVIDTTPAPRVPDDARFITWWSKDTRWYAEMYSGTWRVGRDSLFEAVEDLPGVTPETVFTVLEERKS